ncbi:MAG: co-chaperone GroES [Candidatus Thioglobus sp.]|nr:co-chaperone GroES [Candidatus Thioglobus sp.]
MTPVGKRLIIKRDETPNEKTSESGIILAKTAEKPAIGTVMFNGPGAKEVFAKDKVLFMKFAGTEVSWEGEDYLIMEEKDILAVL